MKPSLALIFRFNLISIIKREITSHLNRGTNHQIPFDLMSDGEMKMKMSFLSSYYTSS